MPYLTEGRKRFLDVFPEASATLGDLTYLITCSLLNNDADSVYASAADTVNYWLSMRQPLRYAHFAEVVGCLTTARLEYIRRLGRDVKTELLADYIEDFYADVVAPYEDQKIEENGDVYP